MSHVQVSLFRFFCLRQITEWFLYYATDRTMPKISSDRHRCFEPGHPTFSGDIQQNRVSHTLTHISNYPYDIRSSWCKFNLQNECAIMPQYFASLLMIFLFRDIFSMYTIAFTHAQGTPSTSARCKRKSNNRKQIEKVSDRERWDRPHWDIVWVLCSVDAERLQFWSDWTPWRPCSNIDSLFAFRPVTRLHNTYRYLWSLKILLLCKPVYMHQ